MATTNTITITLASGHKVRTVRSRRYFLVTPTGTDGKAHVVTRSDSLSSIYTASRRWPSASIWDARADTFVTREAAAAAHRRKLAEAREARRSTRSVWY